MSDNGKVLRFNDVPLNHFDVQNRASWKLHEHCEQYCVKQLILSKFKVIFCLIAVSVRSFVSIQH